MNTAYIIIAVLFAVVLLIAWLFTGKRDAEPAMVDERIPVPPVEKAQPPARENSEGERHFRAWLTVLYQDNPQQVDDLMTKIAAKLPAANDHEYAADELWQRAIAVFDAKHLFAAEDKKSLINGLNEMAMRFRFEFTPTNLPSDLTEDSANDLDAILQTATPIFAAKNACLFVAKQDNKRIVAVVPKRDSEEFVQLAKAWGASFA
ncbi:MAG: hypothetical protein Q4E16_03100 [Neisseria sp.]|nr:hypothetical protein [Neisseria sp.]